MIWDLTYLIYLMGFDMCSVHLPTQLGFKPSPSRFAQRLLGSGFGLPLQLPARRALSAEALLRGVHRTQGLLDGLRTSGRLLADLAALVW